ncbi:MAG: DCC1-like thiol-disulfide oxidoreductase family protein [Armatimonadota bacterium]|nr:DCC1-like thiol-disulfide oxidoreductase family protein [Armatimonadota bacterium]
MRVTFPDRLLRWFTREHWLVGASLVRVLLGAWALYYYVLHFPVRRVLWGPQGLWPFDRFVASQPFLSVWQLSPSPVFFEVVYLAGIAIALALTLGWWSRVAVALHWLMVWSLQQRNPFITDGGDNIMRLVLLFLMLVDTGAHFSLDARRVPRLRPGALKDVRAVFHNVGVLLIVGQLAMLYMSTGLYKAMGELWQNGTAVYYILRVDEFSWPGVAEFIYRSPLLVVLGTYGTVLFEVMFFPALFNRWTRRAAMAAGVAFHVSIALLMGLVTFAWSMLSIYPLLVPDAEYRTLGGWLRRRLHLVAFYDGWCAWCRRSVRWWGMLDVFGFVQYVSFRDPGVAELYGLDPDRARRRIQVATGDGRLREGMDALAAIAVRVPPLWPALPILVGAYVVAGQRLYDAVATRRPVLLPGACEARCAVPRRPPGASRGETMR